MKVTITTSATRCGLDKFENSLGVCCDLCPAGECQDFFESLRAHVLRAELQVPGTQPPYLCPCLGGALVNRGVCVLVLRWVRCVQQGLEDGSRGACPGWTLPLPLLSGGQWSTCKKGKPLGCSCHQPPARQSPRGFSILKKPCAHPIQQMGGHRLPGLALPNPQPRRLTVSHRQAPGLLRNLGRGPLPPALHPTYTHRQACTRCPRNCFRDKGLSEPLLRLPREHLLASSPR